MAIFVQVLKRLITIPFLFIYIIAVSGVMMELHYCGQELASMSLFSENDGCADDGCGDESTENDGCCKDEVVVAKVVNDQNIATQQLLKFIDAGYDANKPEFTLVLSNVLVEKAGVLPYSSNAPPGFWQNIPLYKLYTNFTYYG